MNSVALPGRRGENQACGKTGRQEFGEGRGFDEDGAAAGPVRAGHAVIRDYLRRLDERPGVYRMLDARGDVLYVGKARNLRKRVAAYAKPFGHSSRIARMIAATAGMMFLTTDSEIEALLLEQNLIKQLKPRYNVSLRDDKSFPNIHVTADHPFPQIRKHRGLRKEPGRYFGPFASAGSVNRTLNQLQKAFLLRSCSDSMFESRTRPCLLYQIKRCSAPCVGLIGEAEYAALVEDAVMFLSGKSTRVQEQLADTMAEASRRMEFERAAALRDRIRALTNVQANQGINPEGVEEADVVALHQEGGHACVQVFFIRAHQNWGNRAYFPAHRLRGRAGRDPRGLPRAVLRQQDAAAGDLDQPSTGQRRPLVRSADRPARAQGDDRAAAARREGGAGRAGGTQRPRGAGAPDGGEREPDGAARGHCRDVRARRSRRSGSRSTTTATSWGRTRSAA